MVVVVCGGEKVGRGEVTVVARSGELTEEARYSSNVIIWLSNWPQSGVESSTVPVNIFLVFFNNDIYYCTCRKRVKSLLGVW